MASTPSIGRTLSRLAILHPRRSAEGDAALDSRAQILQLIQRSDAPVSVESLCRQTELHANTVRGHLEVLVASGQVVREPGRSAGRGRPPMLYRAGTAESSVYRELTATLIGQLGEATDPELIDEAAGKWAEVVDETGPAGSIDEAVGQAASALDQLGFSAHVSPVGDSVILGSCPYAALIADQPVICDIHTALLRDLLGRTGQPVTVADMEVWAAPGMCRAHLNRPDRSPARVIAGEVPDGPSGAPEPATSKRKKQSA